MSVPKQRPPLQSNATAATYPCAAYTPAHQASGATPAPWLRVIP